jgi:hypothetical protein
MHKLQQNQSKGRLAILLAEVQTESKVLEQLTSKEGVTTFW